MVCTNYCCYDVSVQRNELEAVLSVARCAPGGCAELWGEMSGTELFSVGDDGWLREMAEGEAVQNLLLH